MLQKPVVSGLILQKEPDSDRVERSVYSFRVL